MFTKKRTTLVALAACALALAALGSAKNPVTRPMRSQAQGIMTIDLTTGAVEYEDWGEGTHIGRYTSYARGYYNEEGQLVMEGSSTIANGEQVFFVLPGTEWETGIVGGTGHLAGCSGGVNTVSQTVELLYADEKTQVLLLDYVHAGVITY